MNAAAQTETALVAPATVADLGILAFNTALAKKLTGLKKTIGVTKISQGYRGTGKQSHRRQIWIYADGLPGGSTDRQESRGFGSRGTRAWLTW